MRWEQSGSGYANSVTWGYDDNNNLSTQKQTLNGTTYTTSYTYDKDNRLTKTTEGTVSAGYAYDALGRMTAMDAQSGGKPVVKTTIGYNDPSSTTATGQVKTWKSGATTYTYAYDARGNITSVSDGQSTTTYAYDSFDQLVRENNQAAGKTWTYAYDDGGNIQSKTEYAYTNGTLGAAVRTVAYGYGDASWSDLLTSIGGQSLTADEIGNLLSDGTWTYTWQHGRQLAGMSKTGTNIAYGYDSDGKRITKTVNGTAYNYHYLGDQLVELTWGGNKLHFTYDSTGPLSMNCNGTEYFYVRNAQGDVTGLVNASGTRVVTYTYDAWGNPLSTTGSMATTLGAQNPLRYRGYVYDTETGLYYLQSRYYNPGWGRFINADAYASTGQGIIGNNMFAYCGNNPTNCIDRSGKLWKKVGSWFKQAWADVKSFVGHLFGAEVSVVNQVEPRPKEYVPPGLNAFITVKAGNRTSNTISRKGKSTKPFSVYAQERSDNLALSSVGAKINIPKLSVSASIGLDNMGLSIAAKSGDTTYSLSLRADLSQLKVGVEMATTVAWDENTDCTSYVNIGATGVGIVAIISLIKTGNPDAFSQAIG